MAARPRPAVKKCTMQRHSFSQGALEVGCMVHDVPTASRLADVKHRSSQLVSGRTDNAGECLGG